MSRWVVTVNAALRRRIAGMRGCSGAGSREKKDTC